MLTLADAAKLGLTGRKSSVRIENIDSSSLEIFGMTLAKFLLQDNKKILFSRLAQVPSEVKLALPKWHKIYTKILLEYFNYAFIFSPDFPGK